MKTRHYPSLLAPLFAAGLLYAASSSALAQTAPEPESAGANLCYAVINLYNAMLSGPIISKEERIARIQQNLNGYFPAPVSLDDVQACLQR